jgi:hypothetical protein
VYKGKWKRGQLIEGSLENLNEDIKMSGSFDLRGNLQGDNCELVCKSALRIRG